MEPRLPQLDVAAPVTAALAGVRELMRVIHAGMCSEVLRLANRYAPNTISAEPTTMRNHDAQLGGLDPMPPTRSESWRKIPVSTASPSNQPARNASPVGFGLGVPSTSTAGMTENGDSAITRESGMSSVRTDPQVPGTRKT